jgi:alpha-glucosidase (family GH31 glycosyl hydrolase)
MKFFFVFGLLLFAVMPCTKFTKDEKRINLKVKDILNSYTKMVRVDVVSDNIIKGQSYPDKKIAPKESLMNIDTLNLTNPDGKLADKNDTLYLSTSVLLFKVSKASGKAGFYDTEAARKIDYYFSNGKNADEILSGYREITGKAPIMPEWAMGLWQSSERYKTKDELVGNVKEYRKRNITQDNIVLDWQYLPEEKSLTIGERKGQYPGMLKNKKFIVMLMSTGTGGFETSKAVG